MLCKYVISLMLLLNSGEPLANKRRGLRIRGLAPVGDIFCSLSLSLHSMSSVTPPCTFLHETLIGNRTEIDRKNN